jgi:hypothetical protein
MRTNRDRSRIRRRTRKQRLRILRQRLAATEDAAARKRLIARMRRISATAPVPEK